MLLEPKISFIDPVPLDSVTQGGGPVFLWVAALLALSSVLACALAVIAGQRQRRLLSIRTEELNLAKTQLQSIAIQLEAASRLALQVQEMERRSIARELHDELGQSLTAMRLLLHAGETRHSWEPVREAKALAADLLRKVRRISLDLRPSMLDDLGLLPAVEWHLKRFARQTGIQVCLRHSDTFPRLPMEVETAAYRVMQEALNNVARHADVGEAQVEIWRSFGELRLDIEDHGKGFAPGELSDESSGLAGIRERIKLLHGHVQIHSAIGTGTKISMRVPCDLMTPSCA